MTQADSIVEAQMQHMLEVIDEYRQHESKIILAEAKTQVSDVVNKAYADTRQRLRQSILQERIRIREAITSAQAQLDTRTRQQQQKKDQSSLTKAWTLLQQQLTQSWQHAETQEQWLTMALNQATKVLPHAAWVIHHSPSWSPKENNFAQQVEQQTRYTPVFRTDENINAGLRISYESACVDATLDGLLHDRSRIESMLLINIHQQNNGISS